MTAVRTGVLQGGSGRTAVQALDLKTYGWWFTQVLRPEYRLQ